MGRGILGVVVVVGEEGFPGPEEEDSVEAARLIRLGGLEVEISYDGKRMYEDVYEYNYDCG